MRWYISTRARLGLALLGASLVSVGLFIVHSLNAHSIEYRYLAWNLCLAWIPLVLVLWLEKILRQKLWSSWMALFATVLFVIFLPNTFYMVTDLIHLQEVPQLDIVTDVVMFCSFVFTAFTLGLLSVYMLHKELNRRVKPLTGWLYVGGLLLTTSFAIYIGRDLRWNSWDIIVNPASILFEVSDHVIHPIAHPQVFATTLSFFVFIGSVYAVTWHAARAVRQQKNSR